MSQYEEFEIHSEAVQGYQKVTFSGTLIYGHTDLVKEKIMSLLDKGNDCLLDLRKLSLIDSIGFGVLINIAKKITESRRRMVIILNNESIYKLFSVVRFQHIVPIVATEQDALKVLTGEII